MRKMSKIFLILIILFKLGISQSNNGKSSNDYEDWKFVSSPDLFNFDIPNPWPQWEKAVNWYLNQVEIENPEFFLMAGDMVDGRWSSSAEMIEQAAALYYPGWTRRMESHNLTYYTAIGDHELGDNPWPKEKARLAPKFEQQYCKYLKMPENGPQNKKGLAYYVRHKNVLVITLETFTFKNDTIYANVDESQLEWFKEVVAQNQDAKFIVVQGHLPIWGDLSKRSSSGLMLDNGRESDLFKTMKEVGVDLYLCGEFHDVNINESDGIVQVVHGSSWGRKKVPTQDYLVCEVKKDKLNLTLKRIYKDAKGDRMWNINKPGGPFEIVEINDKSLKNGPEVTGKLIIDKSGDEKKFTNASGYFREIKK